MDTKNQSWKIKPVSIIRIFWFTKLNIEIHKEDPIFKEAKKSTINLLKFTLNLGFKLFWQKKFVITVDRKTVGAISLERRKKSVFIYAVGVLPEYRRKGFGTLLMNFAEEFARKKDRDFITFSVLLANKPAINLYEKLGYKSLGIGLTLIRILTWKLEKLKKIESSDVSFEEITARKKAPKKLHNYWNKEIEAFVGEDGYNLSIADSLIDFKIHNKWKIYTIKTNTTEIGILLVIPRGLMKTIVLFTDPVKTWSEKWHANFLYSLQLKLLSLKSEVSKTGVKQKEKTNYPLIQIFLTYQHKLIIENSFDSKFILHDSTGDRQIYFKKIN